MYKAFSFTGAKKIVFGCGSFSGLVGQVRDLRAKKPFVAVDGNLAKLGVGDRIAEMFDRGGMKAVLYDRVLPEPPLEQADEGAGLALKGKCDIVIGIGGGSAMDVAKAVAVVAAHGAEAKDFLGLNRVPGPGLPTIMVPTTAGTGSEVTFTAVFVRHDLKKKEGMNSMFMYPDLALLDPELTLSLPPQPTAASGMDALCHAIESYTSVIASPASEMFSLRAIGLIAENLRTCVHNGGNLEAREAQMLGSLYAGIGLANAGVGAAHSLSYPLGGKYGISHGVANTLMLPRIMEFNLPGALEKFADVAEMMGENTEGLSVRDAAMLAVEAVDALIEDCGIATGLEELGIPEEDYSEMARVAMTVARPLENNPRKVTLEDAIAIYRTAM
ncbi:MAG: iron-containing alcohol dehydrogenase [Pseudomonadota bacterium]|jgi:alcohol dehydrogenase|nr:iron-containing alcohol dehydrogenase [Syntrophobacterales bacterium]MDI9554747.1 iron-containing alcohol dehydrogenase [Pseudomonadota bacterium]NLX30719.1 iron-containing alcohol dehydrogenase [Deltaproteobacteria bacterium]HNU84627.1 iron-containing alcohol dehydrogenase [Syntrophales bacterium]HNZ33689.1 iron-containing alcohol dehydrogenase [Syntrophales bacterium]